MRSSSEYDLNSPLSSLLNRKIAVGSAGNLTVIAGGYKAYKKSVSVMSAYPALFGHRMNKSGTAGLFSPSLSGNCHRKIRSFFILQESVPCKLNVLR